MQRRSESCAKSATGYEKKRSHFAALLAGLLLLIPLSTSCAAWQRPPPEALDSAVCQRLNPDQWAGVVNLSLLAVELESEGDEDHIGAAVRVYGRMLKRCFPELFYSE